jgi:poly(3-hydroxybutyrate) depolymerase
VKRALLVAVLATAVMHSAVNAEAARAPTAKVRVVKIAYRAHNGATRAAYVVLPSWYGRRFHPRIPLVISPHGRGLTGRQNARLWGNLPARGPFAVVNPDGNGRRLASYSWGYRGQIDDLARMPAIVRKAVPWLRIDSRRVYAFGGSMGGQESLLLLARKPRLLAGVAVFDAVTDFALQYKRFPLIKCNTRCRKLTGVSIGVKLRRQARTEVGGTPARVPRYYASRSPITYLQRIARSCVPLQLWWSVADQIVSDAGSQSGKLFWDVRRLNTTAPVQGFVGYWIHSRAMRSTSRLPYALAEFGLLKAPFFPPGKPAPDLHRVVPAARTTYCGWSEPPPKQSAPAPPVEELDPRVPDAEVRTSG